MNAPTNNQIDSTIFKLFIPVTLLFTLFLIIRSIQNTKTNGIIFMDYFKLKKLEVILAMILMYMMLFFLAMTIIFTYSKINRKKAYTKNNCDPLVLYLGDVQNCNMVPQLESFGNNFHESRTFMEKITDVIRYPQKIYLAIVEPIQKTYETISLKYNKYMDFYLDKHNYINQKITNGIIDPMLVKIANPIQKMTHIL